ncbi:MAG: translesion error-prone DNA polymerase V autoproteolytic subunit [Candidatus Caenarcaniphilales bacterium]|nr:translesion error-prone DNA polymerase V autoproteolytic subunit [Candidatus Caenarcaniphilales bacterium]
MNLNVTKCYTLDQSTQSLIELYSSRITAGFPSPGDDYVETKLDLNRYLIKNPTATYFVKVSGESMINAGIHDGDILIVDRSLEPKEGDIVIAELDGELTVKRLGRINKKLHLISENPDYESIPVYQEANLQIWGVVSYAIHKTN